jgi:E3 ubiquitin-protein ligase SHPRH
MFRYFRQLQEISDSVREAEWGDVGVEQALRDNSAAQAELERKINTGRARQRFVRSDSPSAKKNWSPI